MNYIELFSEYFISNFWLFIFSNAVIFGAFSLFASPSFSKRSTASSQLLPIFFVGFFVGFVVFLAFQLIYFIPDFGTEMHSVFTLLLLIISFIYFIFTLISLLMSNIKSNQIFFENLMSVWLGNFVFQPSFVGFLKGVSRFSWELLQTILGNIYSAWACIFGGVSRVDYFDGVTFLTRENFHYRKGIAIGNYVNIWISDKIDTTIDQRLLKDPLFMHEFGHTVDSRNFGYFFLLIIGIPSIISALLIRSFSNNPTISSHQTRWFELRANRNAAKFFKKFGVDWNSSFKSGKIDTYFPRKRK